MVLGIFLYKKFENVQAPSVNQVLFNTKSAQPLNEVRVAKPLTEYFIKYSQSDNAKSDYFNRFSSILSFEPSKPKEILL